MRRMKMFVGPANTRLGAEVCRHLECAPGTYECHRFPDGETQMEVLESVRGCDVFLLQSTSPPVEIRLIELLLLADACRRAGAQRLVAVIPYFGYARQDRRTSRQSLGAAVAANALTHGGLDRIMLVDAHTPAIEGFFGVPMDHLTAVPLLSQAAAPRLRNHTVVVAPDLGAVKRAREYARKLHVPMAVIHKTRHGGDEVAANEVIGDVRGRSPLVVDDMLSTGGTIEAACTALRTAGALEPVSVIVTHALLTGRARERLQMLPIERLLAADTVESEGPVERPLEFASVAPLIATAVLRDHRDESLADLRVST
jgi:ribose-phosphate pyrophosphokinase